MLPFARGPRHEGQFEASSAMPNCAEKSTNHAAAKGILVVTSFRSLELGCEAVWRRQ
jgi:hypothetical protein